MNGPSEKAKTEAVEAVERKLFRIKWETLAALAVAAEVAPDAVEAAHDPALGLDGSICKRDVVEWLRDQGDLDYLNEIADDFEREMG